jgi:hypothetical protein
MFECGVDSELLVVVIEERFLARRNDRLGRFAARASWGAAVLRPYMRLLAVSR